MVSKLLLQWLLVMMTVVEAYLTQFLREKPISFLCSYFCCCNCFHFFTQTTTYDVHQMNRKKVENLIWFVFERTVRGIAFKRTISARCEFKVNCFLFRIGREKFNNVVDAFFPNLGHLLAQIGHLRTERGRHSRTGHQDRHPPQGRQRQFQ